MTTELTEPTELNLLETPVPGLSRPKARLDWARHTFGYVLRMSLIKLVCSAFN